MKLLLPSLGLSQGIIETIKWWLPYIGVLLAAIIIVLIINTLRKKRK